MQTSNEINASLQKLFSGNGKCDDDTDNADRYMIPMYLPCSTGHTKMAENLLSLFSSLKMLYFSVSKRHCNTVLSTCPRKIKLNNGMCDSADDS